MLKRIGLAVLLSFVLVSPSWAAITFDAASSSEGTTSTSHSATIAADANIAIVCVAIRESGGAPAASSSVTVGGAAATLLGAINAPSGSPIRAELWYKLSPATGSQTVAVTSAATTDFTVTGVMTFKGVAQTSTFNTVRTVALSGSSAAVDVDTILSAAGEEAALCGAVRTSAGADPTASADATSPVSTERYEDPHTTDVSIMGMGYTEAGAATSINMRVDLSLGNNWAAVAASMRPAAGGSGSTTKYLDNSAASVASCTNGDTTYSASTRLCGSGTSTVYDDRSDAFANIGASNTLIIRAGTYTDQCSSASIANGSAGNPTIITNYPGEVITLVPNGTRSCIVAFGQNSYISFIGDDRDNFIVDGNEFLFTDPIFQATDTSTHHLVFDHITVKNSNRTCIFIRGADTSAITVRYSHIYNCGIDTDGNVTGHGVYIPTDGALIEHNEIHNIEGWAVHCFDTGTPACDNATIRYNLLYDFGQDIISQPVAAGIVVDGNNDLVYRNSIRCNTGSSDRGFETNALTTNALFYFNSITNCNIGAIFTAGSTGALAKNNISYGNTTAFSGVSGTAVTYDNNLCAGAATGCEVIGNPLFTDAANHDLRLSAGSPAINAGVAIAGFLTNSTPDIGGFETFGYSSAAITGNTLDVTLLMSLNIPVLPATMIPGEWTVNNGRTITAAAKKSGTDSVVSLTVSGAACTDVQTWTVSYTPGTVTDSAQVGGDEQNQPMTAFATQAVTNNCGAPAATGTLEQKTHQFTQSQTPGNALGAVGAASTDIRPGTSFALVTQIDCTVATCESIGLRLYYRKNAGAYAAVPDTMGADQIAFLGTVTDPAYLSGAVTCCLSGALTANNGTTGFTSAAVPVFTLTQDSSIVQRRQLILGPSAAATDTYEFKEYNQTGVVLNGTYTPANGGKLTVSAATLDAPTGLQLAQQAGGNVGLVWSPSTDSALLGYRLYQSAVSGVQGTLVATLTPASAAASHSPITQWFGHLTPGTWYFLITQFDTGGQESPIPPEVTVVAPAAIARTARVP